MAILDSIMYVYIACCPFSIPGSLFIIFTYGIYNELHKPGCNFVFFQAICDLFFSAKYFVTVILEIYDYNQCDPARPFTIECTVLGFVDQLSAQATCAWNFVMSALIFNVIWDAERFRQIEYSKWKYHLYVWIASLSMSLIPFFMKLYGPTADGCWIMLKHKIAVSMFFLMPVSFYLLYSVGVMLFVTYKLHFSKSFQAAFITPENQYDKTKFAHQLMKYVAIYLIFWLPPITFHVLQAVGINVWVYFFTHWAAFCFSLQGFANACVWGTSPQFLSLVRKRLLYKRGYAQII